MLVIDCEGKLAVLEVKCFVLVVMALIHQAQTCTDIGRAFFGVGALCIHTFNLTIFNAGCSIWTDFSILFIAV